MVATIGIKSFFVGIFAYMSWILTSNYNLIANDLSVIIGTILLVVLSIYLAISLALNLQTLVFSQQNQLIILDDKLIQHFNRKVLTFEFAEIKDLKLIRVIGSNRPFPVFGKFYIEFWYNSKKFRIGKGDFYKNFNSFQNILTTKIYD